MPLTPYHMGPGMLVKAILRGAFSLMVFGWTQVLIDVQPLAALALGGREHGFSHTYVGATVIAVFAAVTGKYLADLVLRLAPRVAPRAARVGWRGAFLSAVIGAYSHILLDSMVHSDLRPFAPFSQARPMLGWWPASAMNEFCVYTGIAGVVLYFGVGSLLSRRQRRLKNGKPREAR